MLFKRQPNKAELRKVQSFLNFSFQKCNKLAFLKTSHQLENYVSIFESATLGAHSSSTNVVIISPALTDLRLANCAKLLTTSRIAINVNAVSRFLGCT